MDSENQPIYNFKRILVNQVVSKHTEQSNNITMTDYFSKVKEFLLDLGFDLKSENTEDNLVVITDEEKGISNLMLDLEDNLLILEQFIFQLKNRDNAQVLRRLLQINRNLVHGALAIDEENRVIFRDTLQLENLDRNEIEASINAIGLMMAEYAEEFIRYAKN